MKPTFIGIGAQKCASTWIYDILADHPQVCMSARKEIDFFSNYYDYGFQWYERHFEGVEESLVAGEVSPSYFHDTAVTNRVYDYNPDMRLILLLRDPVERAISNHKHEVRIGRIQGNDLGFEYGLANNPSYIEQGLYATHLERWLKYFNRDQILIILFDDIVTDRGKVARDVYRFLSVDDGHRSASLYERSNESYVNRYPLLEKIKDSVRAVIRKAHLGAVWDIAGGIGLQKAYRTLNRRSSEAVIPPMKDQEKQELRKNFTDEIRRLEKLIDRSLDHWR